MPHTLPSPTSLVRLRRFVGASALLLFPVVAQAQLAVTPLGASPPSSLVTGLLGPGITVSNVTYAGSVLSAGTFTGGTAAFGFPDGIVLSTGYASSLTGFSFMEADTALGTPGDPDLDALVGTSFTNDATVLEFDFIPTQPGIYFEYVFASEEYNAYVGGGFDDVFGFFINGVNAAHLPGTTITVSVDNVNNCSNPSYYVDNVGDSSASCLVTRTPAGRPTAMNGMTTTLRVLVSLPPGVPSHLKLAIADTGDAFLDSNVLLRAGSFISLDPSATPTPTLTATTTPTPTATPSPTPTPTPCGFPGLTCTPTPLPEDVFFVSKNLFTPDLDGPVSIYVSYPSYPGPYALKVYNSAGENVKNLDQDHLTAPVQRSYLWDGKNEMGEPCASGIYLLSLTEPFDRKLRKVLLVR